MRDPVSLLFCNRNSLFLALCGALARDVRAGTLLLTHLNPLYDPQALLAEAREAYPAAELAVAGARYRG